MQKSIPALFLLLFGSLATGSLVAGPMPSWTCDSTGTELTCTEAARALQKTNLCETHCSHSQSSLCLCRTHAVPDAVAAQLDPTGQGTGDFYRFWMSSEEAERIQEKTDPIVAELVTWAIPTTLEGEGPHAIQGSISEDGEIYTYSGEITFWLDTVSLHFELQGHPTLRTVRAQFDTRPHRHGGFVVVETDKKKYRHEI